MREIQIKRIIFYERGLSSVRARNNIKCVTNMHCSKKSLQFQGYVLEFKTVEAYFDNFIPDLESCVFHYAPVAQWIEQWFPVPCAGVRFPSGVLPGTV